MDNSGAKSEAVARTYRGFDGCAPIAAYVGSLVKINMGRLPSGKIDTNGSPLHLTGFTHNCLRLLGGWADRQDRAGASFGQTPVH